MNRPRSKVAYSPIDKFLTIIGWMCVLVLWALVWLYYQQLPEVIPTHFNIVGEVDAQGAKATLLLLPTIGTVLFIGLIILGRFPHSFNYPVVITTENALRQYTNATRFIRYFRTAIMLIFIRIVYVTCQTALGGVSSLGMWFLPGTLSLVFIPLIFFVIKSFQIK